MPEEGLEPRHADHDAAAAVAGFAAARAFSRYRSNPGDRASPAFAAIYGCLLATPLPPLEEGPMESLPSNGLVPSS
jgi:hypothetical protein